MSEEFSVEEWIGQAKTGRERLMDRKRELMAQRNELDMGIADVDRGIAKIDAVLGPVSTEVNRSTGVLVLTRDTVRAVASVGFVSDDSLVTEVLRRDPMMKPTSIRSALRTLMNKGEAERSGKRGSHAYRWSQSAGAESPSDEDRINNLLANAGKAGLSEKDLAWTTGDSHDSMEIVTKLIADNVVERFPVGDGEYRFRLIIKDGPEEEPRSTLFG